jgi:IS5 family transposase
MKRCQLKGPEGDAIHAVLCAAGYYVGWLLKTIRKRDLGFYLALIILLGLGELMAKVTEFIQAETTRRDRNIALVV